MKAFTLANKSIIVLLVFLAIGCKKNTDYRDKYTGNYMFIITESIWSSNDSIQHDTLIYTSGNIIKGSTSNEIYIYYLNSGPIPAVLSENGLLSSPQDGALGWGVYGKFESEVKVLFTVSYVAPTWSDSVVGIKK